MREWLSASEIEGLELPGLPTRRTSIIRRAKKGQWKSRQRTGRGAGTKCTEYHVSSLPEEARTELKRRFLAESAEAAMVASKLLLAKTMEARSIETKRQESLSRVASLDAASTARLDARLEILGQLEHFEKHAIAKKSVLLGHFVSLYNARELELSDATYTAVERLSVRSLQRWRRVIDHDGIAALAGRYGQRSRRKYQTVIDQAPEMQRLVLAMMRDNPHINAHHVRRALLARFDRHQVPAARTIQRYLNRWKSENPQLAQYIASPDAWRSKYRVAFGDAAAGIVALNQLWEMDSTPGDIMLAGGRHSVIGVIDVFSRRMKLHVAKTSTAVGVASLMRAAMLDWGIPATIRMDNGSDYTSKHVKRVLRGLEIEPDYVPPFSPEKKPFIERAFRTFAHDLVELLPGFLGHNVAEREALRSRESFANRLMKRGDSIEVHMTPEEFQVFCDNWCRSVYEHRKHDGLGKSPFQVVAGWRQPIRRIENERALDMLLARAPGGDGVRTVRKKGIRIAGLYFQAPELGEHVGEEVLVLYDEGDAGRVLVFGGVQMEFLCVAECPTITGISRQELAVEARRYQKRKIKEAKKELDALAKEARAADIWMEIVAQRADEAAKIHRLPVQDETYSTERLEAAARALDAMDVEGSVPLPEMDETTRAEIARLDDRRERAEHEEPKYFSNDFDKWNHLQAIKHARDLTEKEKAWLWDFERRMGLRGDAENG